MNEKSVPACRLQADITAVAEAWGQSPYYDQAEKWTFAFWSDQSKFRKLFSKLDLTSVIELACGHGRHSEQIVRDAGRIVLIDIFETNLDRCRERLGRFENVSFLLGDGRTFRPLDDGSATSVFCYDAMVHFSPAMVRSYLLDCGRVLAPGGMGLFHHSNYPAPLDKHYGQNPQARNHMTQPLFAEYAKDAGLNVVESIVIPWGNIKDLDAVSLVSRAEV